MRLIFTADGLNLYEMNDSFIVTDQRQHILKESKKIQACQIYISQTITSRRAAERAAIENTHQDKNKNCAI
jgi:hypothetical protein